MAGIEDVRERYGPWAIVAGASEGTGRSFARHIAAHGVACILIANSGPLDAVAEEIKAERGVDCVAARIDLSASDAFQQIVAATGERPVGLYVANAGADSLGVRFLNREIDAWLDLMHINITTTVRSCHHFGKLMLERLRGGILIVNSLGQTDTPAFHRLQAKKGRPSPRNLASPDEVARVGLERLPHGPIHNIGLASGEAGGMPASANTRRERVLGMDAAIDHLFGKIDAA